MGYKLLGYVVWQGAKWYLRRRIQGTVRKAAIAGLAALIVGGVIVAQRRHSSDST
jgi:hypothetical protein